MKWVTREGSRVVLAYAKSHVMRIGFGGGLVMIMM